MTSNECLRLPVRAFPVFLWAALLAPGTVAADGSQPAADSPSQHPGETPASRGYRLLRTKPFVPPDLDREVFENLWTTWPEPLRSQAERATPAERRRMTFSRYGLVESPESPDAGPPLGYVEAPAGGWVMNCLNCHGGKVAGRIIPGLPNNRLALQTLTEEALRVKLELGRPPGPMDLAALRMSLGTSHGTTNAVVFGIIVGWLRDRDMNIDRSQPLPPTLDHDMDAPALWNVRKRTHLYCDGHAPKVHRPLLQFTLSLANDGPTIRGWEDEARDILAWIESLEPPNWPWGVDAALAGDGERLFRQHCARCHGTYGETGRYVERIIPIDTVGTDPLRLNALSVEDRRRLGVSWMTRYGEDAVIVDPGGYVAPPLDGIWASAPYFHNGSVPTLWHVLHPDARPAVWQGVEDGYDREHVGLEVHSSEAVPADAASAADRRAWFDTRVRGKSAAGHRFPDALTETEKRAVLEYLKTL
ncbi:MAG TPA: cytochrome c [Planctomycetaceae bacterium]|nr:cytochrome c [Planctomycetaceae bacterium]